MKSGFVVAVDGPRLREIVTDASYASSLTDVAAEVGVSIPTIWAVITGKRPISMAVAARIHAWINRGGGRRDPRR